MKNFKTYDKWAKSVLRFPPPFLGEILKNYYSDYGEMWAITAAPSSQYYIDTQVRLRRRGIGKSVLAVKLLIHTYYNVYKKIPSWDEIKRYIFFEPKEFVDLLKELRDKKMRIPIAVWDDAGEWLFRSRAREKFIVRIAESLEVIRTVIANLFFTTTSIGKLARAVRESILYVITVAVISERRHRDGTVVKISRARLYEAAGDYEWMFNRRIMPRPLYEYDFTVWLPDEIYKPYFEYRLKYVDAAIERIWDELEKLSKKAKEEEEKDREAEIEDAERELVEFSSSLDMKDAERILTE